MELEKRMENLSSMKVDSEREKLAILISSLAPMEMLMKLMKRKNSGKKPFSSEFGYDKKITYLQQTMDFLKEKVMENDVLDSAIKERILQISEISFQAGEEIRMASLKNDFLWIAERLALDVKMF